MPISFSGISQLASIPPKDTRTVSKSSSSTQDIPPTNSNMPVVALDVDIVTDTIAARLAMSFLGHVLFLKNQIPLPIIQLARMSTKKSDNKKTKLRDNLLTAFDTLASHLVTTFTALSAALAQCTSLGEAATHNRVYLVITIGPSLGAAKSRVICGVDGFETRVLGNVHRLEEREHEEATGSGDELPEESEDDDSGEEECSETDSETSDGVDAETDDRPDDEGTEDEDKGDEEDKQEQDDTEQDTQAPLSPPYQSYAEEQRFLQAADRLLARTLASADANGCGISNEMSPSQTHVLIRAPRRFSHPAWIPRQNLVRQMENSLTDFLGETWPPASENSILPTIKKRRVEGVWITGKGGLGRATLPLDPALAQESDEMIWWSWDGKLIGFADW